MDLGIKANREDTLKANSTTKVSTTTRKGNSKGTKEETRKANSTKVDKDNRVRDTSTHNSRPRMTTSHFKFNLGE